MKTDAFFKYLMALAVAVLLPCSVLNASEDSGALLTKQFADMQNLQGKFQQQIVDEQGAVMQEAEGRFAVKRPRHFYWQTQTPYEHLLVAKGQDLWLYDIDLEQITRKPFSEKLDQAPALILSGELAALGEQFAIVHEGKGSAEAPLRFTLTPKQEGSVFEQLSLSFVNGAIQSLEMLDNFQQQTNILFSELVYNGKLDDKLFDFSPPPGIDVIHHDQ